MRPSGPGLATRGRVQPTGVSLPTGGQFTGRTILFSLTDALTLSDTRALHDTPAALTETVTLSDTRALHDTPAALAETVTLSDARAMNPRPLYTEAISGIGARQFNGSSDYAQNRSGAAPLTSKAGPWTIAGWVKIPNLAQTQTYIHQQGSSGSMMGILYGYTANSIEFNANVSSGANPQTGSQMVIPSSGWHHIAYRKAASGSSAWDMFLDGVKTQISASIAFTLQISGSYLNTLFGCAYSTSSSAFAAFCNCVLSSWLILPTSALSDAQIAALAAGGDASQYEASGFYWPLTGLSSPEPDLGPNALNLTLNGTVAATRGGISDARAMNVGLGKSETVTLTDQLKGFTVLKSALETLGLTDTESNSVLRTITDTITFIDTVSGLAALAKLLQESLVISDELLGFAVLRAAAETLILADTKRSAVLRTLAETVTLSDARAMNPRPLYTEAISGIGARQFNGSSDYAQNRSGAAPLTSKAGPWTIAGWVKIPNLAQTQTYVHQQGSSGSMLGIIYGYTANSIEFNANVSSGANPQPGSQMVIPSSGWHHIAYRKAASGSSAWDMFLDGVKTQISASIAFTLQISGSYLNTLFGCAYSTNTSSYVAFCNCVLSSWLILPTSALSDAQIAALAAGGDASQYEASGFYWPLAGISSPEPDLGPNALNLTLNGTVAATRGGISDAFSYAISLGILLQELLSLTDERAVALSFQLFEALSLVDAVSFHAVLAFLGARTSVRLAPSRTTIVLQS